MKALVLGSLLAIMGGITWAVQEAQRPRVMIKTERGDIILELYPDKAPQTVAHFLQYVDQGLFEGGGFYRVVRLDMRLQILVMMGTIFA